MLGRGGERTTSADLMQDKREEGEQNERQRYKRVEHVLLETNIPVDAVPDASSRTAW